MRSSDREKIPFFPINESADTFLVRPLQNTISPDDFTEVPHRHTYQEIIYVQSGRGRHMIDGQMVQIKGGTFYLILEGQVHQFLEGYDLKGFLIRFTKEFFADEGLNVLTPHAYHLGMLGPLIIPVDNVQKKDMDVLVNQILTEYRLPEGVFKKRIVLQHLISVLIARLERIQRGTHMDMAVSSDNREKQLYLEFNDLLDRYFTQHHRVGFYARKLGVRNRVLSNLVKKISGHTAKKLIIKKLITEAKRKLRFSSMNLKEVTFYLGMDNPAYFSRMFKEQTGESPTSYQRKKKVRS